LANTPVDALNTPTIFMRGKPHPGFWPPGWGLERWFFWVSGGVSEGA
jgi:hypothetical protein